MKQIFIIVSITLLFISCDNKNGIETHLFSPIDKLYSGAFETFYDYIATINKNELTRDKMSEFFNVNFSMIIGNPTLTLPTITEITAVYNDIRTNTYSFICSPSEFNELKLSKLSYMPLTKNSVNIALLDVFLCSENRVPIYKIAFIYNLVFDESKDKWLMNTLTELNPKNYPDNWKQVEIRDSFKYINENENNDIKPLLASELIKGNKILN
jgi:hypothetical protein